MPDFGVVQHAERSPTACITCNTHACDEGFIDSFVDVDAPVRRLYLCGRCVWQMATLMGCAQPHQVAENGAALAAREQEVELLMQALEEERANKVVSLADVQVLLGTDGSTTSIDEGKTSVATAFEPEAATSSRQSFFGRKDAA